MKIKKYDKKNKNSKEILYKKKYFKPNVLNSCNFDFFIGLDCQISGGKADETVCSSGPILS